MLVGDGNNSGGSEDDVWAKVLSDVGFDLDADDAVDAALPPTARQSSTNGGPLGALSSCSYLPLLSSTSLFTPLSSPRSLLLVNPLTHSHVARLTRNADDISLGAVADDELFNFDEYAPTRCLTPSLL